MPTSRTSPSKIVPSCRTETPRNVTDPEPLTDPSVVRAANSAAETGMVIKSVDNSNVSAVSRLTNSTARIVIPQSFRFAYTCVRTKQHVQQQCQHRSDCSSYSDLLFGSLHHTNF